MNEISATSNSVIWKSDKGSECILDFTDYYSNNSSIPFHSHEEDITYKLPKLLEDTINEMIKMLGNSDPDSAHGVAYFLTIVLTLRKALQRHHALRVLEVGCGDGILSYCLAKMLYYLNDSSTLYCMTDTMCTGESDWLLNIDKLDETSAIVNLITSDYTTPILQSDFFDIVIINGYTEFNLPSDVIAQCIRAMKKSGALICITHDQPLLYSSFQIFTDDCHEYWIGNNELVLLKEHITFEEIHYSLSHIPMYEMGKRKVECAAHFSDIYEKMAVLTEENDLEVRELLKQIEKIENTIVENYDIMENADIKFQISEFKEAMCRYLLADNKEEKQYYQSVCINKYAAVKIE